MSQTQATHADSIDSQDPNNEVQKKVKSRRPANTAFRQQRLKAWQWVLRARAASLQYLKHTLTISRPILTPKTVIPLFFIIGIIFAPIGGLLLYASAQVQELVIDYSKCATDAPESDNSGSFGSMPAEMVTSYFKSSVNEPMRWKRNSTIVKYGKNLDESKKTPTTICSLQFTIPDNIGPPVLFYYRLTNFYQNHRRYVKSLDTNQLQGAAVPNGTIGGGSCDPLRLDDKKRPYYPCGLIANSVFNDTFTSPVRIISSSNNETYPMTDNGIAWASDKALYGPTKYNYADIAVPPNWVERWPSGEYTENNPPPELQNDEHFQVWMRTAGLPAFSKLALRNDNQTMSNGMYQVDIQMNFPVTEYGGTKSIVISTRTVMGGRNPFLGIAYVVVGGICIVLGALFTVTHLIKPRKLGDHTYLTWNNDQPSTATATGVSRPGNDAA